MDIKTKRIYDDPVNNDGTRILVDRIWPRGISKEEAKLDDWIKEIAPSTDLRKWFDHKEERFDEFATKYKKELDDHPDLIDDLKKSAEKKRLTLLYAAKDTEHNQAVVLKEYLEDQ